VVVGRLAVSGVVLAWTYGAIQFGRRGLEVVREAGTRYQFASILKNVWTFGVVLAAFLTLITIWGVNLTPLLAAGGIFGIVVGIAAQDAIANFIGGISLYFDNTYQLGDFVHLESGEKGSVVDIGIRSRTLLTPDYVKVTVPHSVLNTARSSTSLRRSAGCASAWTSRPLRRRPGRRRGLHVRGGRRGRQRPRVTVPAGPHPAVRRARHRVRTPRPHLQPHPATASPPRGYRALDDAFARADIEPPYAGRDVRFRGEPPGDGEERRPPDAE
jgi:small-conductance mechanosensitive channel